MIWAHRPKNYWTLEMCKKDALRFNSRKEWKKSPKSGYMQAWRKNWLEECCSHMQGLIKPRGYWTLERCKEDALKFAVRSEWKRNSSSGHSIARANGWLDDCCSHMESKSKPAGYWTQERCQDEAVKFGDRREWRSNSNVSYTIAYKNGWLEDSSYHMQRLIKPRGYWTIDLCKHEALRFNTISEWQRGSGASYDAALRKGWKDDCCSHMESPHNPKGYWTLERCKEDALRFNSRKEWRRKSGAGYSAAYKKAWLEECCAHMVKSPRWSDNNVIYIWKQSREYYNGHPVYKIGVTSERLGTDRINQVNKNAEIIIITKVQGSAIHHEKRLLKIGSDPKYVNGDGRTEYRALSEPELKKAVKYVLSVAA
jgi:hypothetical protein